MEVKLIPYVAHSDGGNVIIPLVLAGTDLNAAKEMGQIQIYTQTGVQSLALVEPTDNTQLFLQTDIGLSTFRLVDVSHEEASPIRVMTTNGVMALAYSTAS